MFKRNSVIALVFSAFALATLCLLAAVSTAQKGSFSTSAAKGAQRSRMNTTVLRPPFRFRPSQSGVSTSSWEKPGPESLGDANHRPGWQNPLGRSGPWELLDGSGSYDSRAEGRECRR